MLIICKNSVPISTLRIGHCPSTQRCPSSFTIATPFKAICSNIFKFNVPRGICSVTDCALPWRERSAKATTTTATIDIWCDVILKDNPQISIYTRAAHICIQIVGNRPRLHRHWSHLRYASRSSPAYTGRITIKFRKKEIRLNYFHCPGENINQFTSARSKEHFRTREKDCPAPPVTGTHLNYVN